MGIVDLVGEGVTGIEPGERYCTLPYFYDMKGVSGDTVIIDGQYLTKAPDGLDPIDAGSIWMQFMTAYYPIVELAKARPGVNILATAATSTAGYSALQIGRLMGANMIATSRFARRDESKGMPIREFSKPTFRENCRTDDRRPPEAIGWHDLQGEYDGAVHLIGCAA